MIYVVRVFDKVETSKAIETHIVEGIDHAAAIENRYANLGYLTHIRPDVFAYMDKYKTHLKNPPTQSPA